jgi:VanZ family protein
MVKGTGFFRKWGPFILLMVAIFAFSSIQSKYLPKFHPFWIDLIVKKGGHMLGYGLLALAFWHGLGWAKNRWLLALMVAVIYAMTDEFHQSFVFGRMPTLVDVAIDSVAAAFALLVRLILMKPKNDNQQPHYP